MDTRKYFTKPSLTMQSFKDSCDVNLILKRFHRDAGQDFLKRHQTAINGLYGDFSDVPDLHVAFDRVRRADALFEALPAKVRQQFDHSVEKFVDFSLDPANLKDLESWGLVPKSAPVQDAPSQTPSSPEVS